MVLVCHAIGNLYEKHSACDQHKATFASP